MRMRDQHPDFKEKLLQRKPSESCYYSSEFWVRALGGAHFCCVDFKCSSNNLSHHCSNRELEQIEM